MAHETSETKPTEEDWNREIARFRLYRDLEADTDVMRRARQLPGVLRGRRCRDHIPFKDNAVLHAEPDAWSRKLCEFLLRRAQWLPHYHRRSNVETVFSMLKRKFGGSIRARRPRSQINEVLCKCLAHNLCCYTKAIFMSGLAPTFWADAKPLLTVVP